MQALTQLALRGANGLALALIYLQHLVALLRPDAAANRLGKASSIK
ncbi:hypothetical protein [Methylobacillus glycogenes]|nr:hypothetical protein [Methylobacillus glycogenes]MBL8504762.1 hypothetical protein [Methylobacillus glycogenes]